jgi:hypothetical protein
VKRLVLLATVAGALAGIAAPLVPATAKPDPICFYLPDLDGHVWGPYCVG